MKLQNVSSDNTNQYNIIMFWCITDDYMDYMADMLFFVKELYKYLFGKKNI